MKLSEARSSIGAEVVDSKSGLRGELVAIRSVMYPTYNRSVKANVGDVRFGESTKAVRLTDLRPSGRVTRKASTPTALPAKHAEVLNAIRSCQLATVRCLNQETKKSQDDETASYRTLFSLLFGRKPTPEEVFYMIGSLPEPGMCERCRKVPRPEFLPDGTPAYSCGCTDAMNKAFGGVSR
jgi:hypothetical protein